jgi:hypothetical protein
MRLIANRQLTGNYGTVVAGQHFETTEDIGAYLVRENMARVASAPRIHYDTKVITPAADEVTEQNPFRYVPMPHPQPAPVATGSNSELSGPNASTTPTIDRLRRPRRE